MVLGKNRPLCKGRPVLITASAQWYEIHRNVSESSNKKMNSLRSRRHSWLASLMLLGGCVQDRGGCARLLLGARGGVGGDQPRRNPAVRQR